MTVSRLLTSLMIYGTEPLEWSTFMFAGVALLAAVVFACWRPARKATLVDPVIALGTL
jgi:hypothetical protein